MLLTFCYIIFHTFGIQKDEIMNKKSPTPFPTTTYYGPEYFCDRNNEIEVLKNNINNHQSTTLIAIRRMGKTGLINHLQHHISKDWETIYIDILSTENLNDLLNSLSTAILKTIPEKTKIGQKIWNFFKSLHVTLSYDPLTGEPNVSFNLKQNESKTQIKNLLQMLDKHHKPVLIAIDEFQQITSYPEKGTDAYLRTIVQQLKNVVFIFSGSQQHIMHDLFSNPSKPFFRSTAFLHLEKIDFETYQKFIIQQFEKHKKKISEKVVEEILIWTNAHTYYVQLLCNRVYSACKKEADTKTWQLEASRLLKEQEMVFFTYREMLTKPQWKLIKAIAKEERVYSITSSAFIQKYGFGSSSGIIRSVQSLLKKELINKQYDKKGKQYYSIYDVLFLRWLEAL